MFFKLQTLVVKTEITYGVDPIPTGAANAILASDVKIMPMKGSEAERDYDRPVFAASQTIPAGLHASISFKVEVKSRTAGTAPSYGPLLKACKTNQVTVPATSVTFEPHSGVQDSVAIEFNLDGTVYRMLGARGTCRYMVNAMQVSYLEFEMTGLFTQPGTAALPVMSYGAQLTQMPQVASSANTPVFTYGGVPLILRSFNFDFGNKITPQFLIGQEEILITDCAESVEMTVNAVPLATFNPFAIAAAATTAALVLTHGTGAGKVTTLTIPALQLMRVEAVENQDGIVTWKLKGTPIAVAGSDQFSLLFI